MSVTTVIYGDVLDLADELAEEFVRDAKAAIAESGDILLREVQHELTLRAGTFQTVAPPGAPPEFDVGDLYRSFTRIPPRVKGRIASSGVQSRHPGGNRLEVGATDVRGIRTLPHPFLAPALAAAEPKVDAQLHARLG